MPKIVEVPGVGNVEFPDSMSDDQIAAQLQKQSTPARPSSAMDHVKNFASNFWGELANAGEGLVNAVKDPIGTVKGIGASQDAVRLKAQDAMKRGDYVEAARHALGYLVPVAGPGIDARGDQAQAGDVSGALGGAASMGLQLAGPAALPKGAGVRVAPRITNPNATEAAALGYLEQKGVPIPAGARTGNAFIKNVQKGADASPLGAVVAKQAGAATTKALQTEAGNLAGRANPTPVVPEQAGAGVRSALGSRAQKFAADADAAYADFRLMEQQTPMSVDMRPIKSQLRPIFDDMSKWMEPARRNASAGFQALKSIVEGADDIPASQAEAGLGGLKQLAREGAGRNAGLAKYATAQLQQAIDGAVQAVDPGAMSKLRQGRSATAAQYGTKAVLDDIRTEPVQAFGQMVYAKDAGVDLLRRVNAEAPGELAKVGRAWLEDLFGKAESQGAFQHADSLYSKWRDLGPQTKRLLFRDPALVSDLDKFFLGVKKLAENPNPSGSATTAISMSQFGLVLTHPQVGVPLVLGSGALSKLLHSPAGVRALTNGMKIPLKAPASALAAGQLLKMAGKDVHPLPAAAGNSPSGRTDLQAAAGIR